MACNIPPFSLQNLVIDSHLATSSVCFAFHLSGLITSFHLMTVIIRNRAAVFARVTRALRSNVIDIFAVTFIWRRWMVYSYPGRSGFISDRQDRIFRRVCKAQSIGHFHVALCLGFKTSPSTKPFIWEWVWFAWKWTYRRNTFSIWMVLKRWLLWQRQMTTPKWSILRVLVPN